MALHAVSARRPAWCHGFSLASERLPTAASIAPHACREPCHAGSPSRPNPVCGSRRRSEVTSAQPAAWFSLASGCSSPPMTSTRWPSSTSRVSAPAGCIGSSMVTCPTSPRPARLAKPDLEALAHLPPWPGCPQGALLALGSGSRPQRHRAALLAFDEAGDLAGAVREIDLSPLYAPLHQRHEQLNIEGRLCRCRPLLPAAAGQPGQPGSMC